MLKRNTVLLLGLWLILLSVLIKIPRDWKEALYFLTGLALVIAYIRSLGRESLYKILIHRRKPDTFTESMKLPRNPQFPAGTGQ